MTKIDIVSGFLGAGKTTLIKKLLGEALKDSKVVLIENEFGEIGIDGGFLKETGIEIREMNSGCICCSLVGDFGASLQEILAKYEADRILIEPSGVGKLSDVKKAVAGVVKDREVTLGSAVTVVDAAKYKMYSKNFGEFFLDQIEHADTIILSRTNTLSGEKLKKCVDMIREHNADADIITTPWEQLSGEKILDTMEGGRNLAAELLHEAEEHQEHHNGHEEHEHSHGHEEGCTCGCHEEHHHAEEVFTSFGMETPSAYGKEEIKAKLEKLEDEKTYGFVLRAKGMLPQADGRWTYFDYVPGEIEVRDGQADVIGRICVIGSKLQEENLTQLFEKN